MDKTILYLGHSKIDPVVKKTCLYWLYKAAEDIPIIEQYQPDDWPLSGVSMYKNIIAGLDKVKTRYVAIAEHDCLYTHEHFSFTPPDEHFWYNNNCWFLQYRNTNHPELDGTFSYWSNRRVQSQLICETERFKEATYVTMTICEDPLWRFIRGNKGVGEPGAVDYKKAMYLTRGSNKSELRDKVKDYISGFNARDFNTNIPNIDIRWGGNFTGHRRGSKRFQKIESWGGINDIIETI
jgi:hypothetical protein